MVSVPPSTSTSHLLGLCFFPLAYNRSDCVIFGVAFRTLRCQQKHKSRRGCMQLTPLKEQQSKYFCEFPPADFNKVNRDDLFKEIIKVASKRFCQTTRCCKRRKRCFASTVYCGDGVWSQVWMNCSLTPGANMHQRRYFSKALSRNRRPIQIEMLKPSVNTNVSWATLKGLLLILDQMHKT